MGAENTSSLVEVLVILAGLLVAFLVEKLLADRFEEPIRVRFFLLSLGLVLGLLSLNFFSKLVFKIIGFSGATLIHQGSAALVGQLIVATLFVVVQIYLSFKVKATNAAFLRGAAVSQVIVIIRSPGLGLTSAVIIGLFVLSVGFSGYHFIARDRIPKSR